MANIYDVDGNPLIISDDEQLEDLLPDRVLVWHDEFKKPEIDPDKWGHIWTVKDFAKDLRLVTESGNGLKYKTIRDNRLGAQMAFSSPEIFTCGKFEFRYGRIEAKIKFPPQTPHHSTFWTLGAPHVRISLSDNESFNNTKKGLHFPSCGEIDIAEIDNGTVGARTHWSSTGFDSEGGYATGGNIASLTGTPTEWHIYSAEWTENTIVFYVDGVQKGTWNTSNADVNGWNPFKIPHYIILNCIYALTGTPTWDVAQTEVKWVRVYAPVGVTEYINETGISIDASASISIGERKWLEPTFTPANPSDMTLNWLSHNEDIVTCYGGMLIGVSAGTTYVQCTTKHGYTALCKVTVS